jgi:hypothetical protein
VVTEVEENNEHISKWLAKIQRDKSLTGQKVRISDSAESSPQEFIIVYESRNGVLAAPLEYGIVDKNEVAFYPWTSIHFIELDPLNNGI